MTRFPFRVAFVAVILPFALAVVGVALQLAWLPELPATIATHWNFVGEPDSFGPAWTMPLLLGVLGMVVFPGLFGAVLARTLQPAGPTFFQKLLASASLFAVSLLSIIVTSSVELQRGVPVGTMVAPIQPTFGAAVLIALALAAGGWFVMPRAVPGRSAALEPAPRIRTTAGETLVWIGHARFATWVMVILCATVAVVVAVIAFVIALRGAWPLAIVPIVVALAILGTSDWRVRIDPAGFSVRSTLGWPRYVIPMADVASAGTTDVVPLGEFGGFGLRWGTRGRVGVITRGGEALEVQRRDGRAVIVTVDDAATAAGVLEAYASKVDRG
jgi:hypothetical protein